MNGVIERVFPQKMYGFIIGDNGQTYFFHRDDYDGHWPSLVDNYEARNNHDPKIPVTFNTRSTPKGPRAANVKIE